MLQGREFSGAGLTHYLQNRTNQADAALGASTKARGDQPAVGKSLGSPKTEATGSLRVRQLSNSLAVVSDARPENIATG